MCKYSIDEIMDMLDWNNSPDVQKKGIELGSKIRCFNVFLQPGHPGHVKNVWENCAKILYQKSDEELRPYIWELLRWLQDMNWPGSFIILERLLKYEDMDMLVFCVEERVKILKGIDDDECNEIWLTNLAELLGNKGLKKNLPDYIRGILEQAAYDV